MSLDSSDNSNQAMQNFKNQLMSAAALMTSSGINNGLMNQMSEFQQQQQQQSQLNSQSYTKPIGSERERQANKAAATCSLLSAALGVPQSAQYQQYLLGASSSASSSSSSPISLSRSQNSSSQTATAAIQATTSTTTTGTNQALSSPNTTSSSDLTNSLIRAATPTTTTSNPTTNISSNNGILGLVNQPNIIMSNFDKEKLLQDLKVQTEMSKKLEAICLQYKQVLLTF